MTNKSRLKVSEILRRNLEQNMKSRISGYGTPQARVVTSRKMGAKDKTMQQSISSTATLSRGRAFNFEAGSPPPPPKTNILNCIIQGRGVAKAIQESSELDLCLYLVFICLCIESTPFWFKSRQEKAVEALKDRVQNSARVAQMMSLVFLSRSVRSPGIFGAIYRVLSAPNSGFGDTLMHDFPTNTLMQKKNRKKLKKGFVMETKGRVLHPFHSEEFQVHQLRVLSDFKTSSKPVLVAMIPEREVESKIAPMKIIVKQGDDFRQDVATMTVFRLFNHLWRKSGLQHQNTDVRCHAYSTCATGIKIGAIEYVENCFPLSRVQKIQPLSKDKIRKLVATGAGSYIASFVLGIRDRHDENIMIRADGVMFHIDFGRVFGDALLLDTDSFAITKEFRDEIGTEVFNEFVRICLLAFEVLRDPKNVHLIHALVPTMFSVIFPKEKVSGFLTKSLMLGVDRETARATLMKQIVNAPESYRTYFKNKIQSFKKQGSKRGI